MPPKKKAGMTAKQKKSAQMKQADAMRQKAKDQIAADKTFGLKNAKKSKKVQGQIAQVNRQYRGDAMKREADARKAKKDKKAAKAAKDAEMAALFGALDESKKGSTKVMFNGKKMTRNEIAAMKEEAKRKREEEAARIAWFNNLSLEEQIEHRRSELDMSKCTKVTEESFRAWREAKDARIRAENEAKVAAEQAKVGKKKGKGDITVLSGKSLFEFDSTLFADDDAAVGADEEFEFDDDGASDEGDFGGAGGGAQMAAFSDDDDDEPMGDGEEESKAGDEATAAASAATAAVVDKSLYLEDDAGLDELDDLDDLDDD